MAVPKKKTSKSRRGMRRSHDHIRINMTVECSNCGLQKRAHFICQHCGFYGGKQVLVIKKDAVPETTLNEAAASNTPA